MGYSWIDSLKAAAETSVTDRQFSEAGFRFPINTPQTKEAYAYRAIFAELYPGDEAAKLVPGGKSVACSTPAAIAWDASFEGQADPSGRAVRDVHDAGYGDSNSISDTA